FVMLIRRKATIVTAQSEDVMSATALLAWFHFINELVLSVTTVRASSTNRYSLLSENAPGLNDIVADWSLPLLAAIFGLCCVAVVISTRFCKPAESVLRKSRILSAICGPIGRTFGLITNVNVHVL